jgi:hypothetical protein
LYVEISEKEKYISISLFEILNWKFEIWEEAEGNRQEAGGKRQ